MVPVAMTEVNGQLGELQKQKANHKKQKIKKNTTEKGDGLLTFVSIFWQMQ
jgi:hypothetical protein